VVDVEALGDFLNSRASFVTQSSLYGYLRTRAGARYTELMTNDEFVAAINHAKWNIWLACVGDLSIFAGRLIHATASQRPALVTAIVSEAARHAMSGRPPADEVGAQFPLLQAALFDRVQAAQWDIIEPDEAVFRDSPAALVRWAPVMDELKQLDEEIVSNSVRFRWQQVRRELRAKLDPAAVIASYGAKQAAMPP
jgi:hypothetical protein